MWMKVDDRLHSHQKTRAVTRTGDKRRDIAPMGLWVAAGSWSAQNGTDGWVPAEELDRWDDDWETLASRLVKAGYWWPQERNSEPGFGFNDWLDYNFSADSASQSGEYGNHVRWHERRGVVEPSCEHCPTEPESGESTPPDRPESGGDRGANREQGGLDHANQVVNAPGASVRAGQRPVSGGDIGGRSGGDIANHRSTRTQPIPTQPIPSLSRALHSDTDHQSDRFSEFWDTYDKRQGRKAAEAKYKLAVKKRGVTEDLLIASAAAYIAYQRKEGKHPDYTKNAATWLNGEHWTDERPGRQVIERNLPRPHELEQPPDGLTPAEYSAWERETRERRQHA